MSFPKFPGWRFGPNGAKAIFDRAEDVPEGWTDNPNDHLAQAPAEQAAKKPAKGKKAA